MIPFRVWDKEIRPQQPEIPRYHQNVPTLSPSKSPQKTPGPLPPSRGEAASSNPVFDAAGSAGYQLLAPRENPGAGLGHCYQSPYRLRCIELMRSAFGRETYRLRKGIERAYGNLTSFGGGLSPLPAWVRHQDRVWLWVSAKLLINAERIIFNKGLAA